MKAVGIICELNPFHSGHAHLIREARRLTGADFTVLIMSGDFVQRGEPAIFNKYTRAKQALEGGADLVFELPVRFCLSSAGDFATGGILALDSLGFVTDLCFGSECGQIEPLTQAAQALLEEPARPACKEAETAVVPLPHIKPHRTAQKKLSFPAARAEYLASKTDLSPEMLDKPNNILGIEYCRAILQLRSKIIPHTIPRKGQEYRADVLSDTEIHPSASALRAQILRSGQPCLSLEDCSDAISYALLRETSLPGRTLTKFKDITSDLEKRIKKKLNDFSSISSFVGECQTRAFTEGRIRRSLLQCAIGLENTELSMPYLRLLGMRAAPDSGFSSLCPDNERHASRDALMSDNERHASRDALMSDNERHASQSKKGAGRLLKETPAGSMQILRHLASDCKNLDNHALSLLQTDIFSSHWYRQVWQKKYGVALPNEYQHPVIIHHIGKQLPVF